MLFATNGKVTTVGQFVFNSVANPLRPIPRQRRIRALPPPSRLIFLEVGRDE
jgi:hypothetical protein